LADSDATGVDPRYDPRFQRGYAGGGAMDAAGSAVPVPSQPSQSPSRESLAELERRASERTARATPREYEPFAPDGADSGVDARPDRDAASISWFDESGAASTGSPRVSSPASQEAPTWRAARNPYRATRTMSAAGSTRNCAEITEPNSSPSISNSSGAPSMSSCTTRPRE
jgi:hypothetical protein